MSEVRPNVAADPFLARVQETKRPERREDAFLAGFDHAQLLDALAKLQASFGRTAETCVRLSSHYYDPREVDLFAALASELRYGAEAIGAIRTIIGGGR